MEATFVFSASVETKLTINIYIVSGGIRSLADVVMVSSTAIAIFERVQDCAGNSCHIY